MPCLPEATFTDALYDHFSRAPGVPRLHGVLLEQHLDAKLQ